MSFKPYLVPVKGRAQVDSLKAKVKSSKVPAFYDYTIQEKSSGKMYSAFTVDRHPADAKKLLGKGAAYQPVYKSDVVGRKARYKVMRF